MTELAGFATWFHKVREDFARVNFGTSGVVCPDSMTTIHDDIQMDKKYWIGLACRLNVCKIPHRMSTTIDILIGVILGCMWSR